MLKLLFYLSSHINKLHFYIFTLLWITVFITLFPFFPKDFIFSQENLEFISIFLNSHKNIIFNCATIYFLIFCIISLLCTLSHTTDRYFQEFQKMTEIMFLIGEYFILLLQLLQNIHIITYGCMDFYSHYEQLIKFSPIFLLSVIGYSITIFSILLSIISYFFDIN